MDWSKIKRFAGEHKRPLVVSSIHLILVLGLWIAWRPRGVVRKRKVIKVGLISMSAGGARQSRPSPPSKAVPTPKHQPRSQPPARKPTPRPKQPSRKTPVRTTTKKTWKARSVEDIRRQIEQSNPQRSTSRKSTSSRRSVDTSRLRRLNEELSAGTLATTLKGEPAAVSSDYLSRLRGVIYQAWRQPTRAEAGSGDLTVTIRLEISRNGHVTAGSTIRRSKSVIMNQSVKLLLENLDDVPPLPKDYEDDTLRVDITLRLR